MQKRKVIGPYLNFNQKEKIKDLLGPFEWLLWTWWKEMELEEKAELQSKGPWFLS